MRGLPMSGPFPLRDLIVANVVTRTSPGNYTLGYMDGEAFRVFFVGRDDVDVRQRLLAWVGMPSQSDRYASLAKASWQVRRRSSFPLLVPALGAVGSADTSYTRFTYSYAASAEAAYERECRDYDDFGGSRALDNDAPPTRARLSA
jgi:hypothetical protein